MIRALWISLTVASLIIFCSEVSAQRVPLELNQTITLPTTSTIWDVMPHPDGYYLWVQAASPVVGQTRIYFGQTNSADLDSIDLDVGAPRSITCFWKSNHEACVALASRTVSGAQIPDTTRLRVFRLSDGQADSSFWRWPSPSFGNGYTGEFNIAGVLLDPPPPACSDHVPVLVIYHKFSQSYNEYYEGWWDSYPCVIISDMLQDTSDVTYPVQGYVKYACPISRSSGAKFACSGAENSMYHSFHDWSTVYRGTASFETVWWSGDGPEVTPVVYCTSDDAVGCHSGATAALSTYVGGIVYCLTTVGSALGAITGGGVAWTVPNSYDFWLATECVPGNSAEEFLCYNRTRKVFDILDASTGWNYGVTDTMTIPPDGSPRVIAHEDSASRRLAFRRENQLVLRGLQVFPDVNVFSLSDFTAAWDSAGVRLCFVAHNERRMGYYEAWHTFAGVPYYTQRLVIPATAGRDPVKTYNVVDTTASDSVSRTRVLSYFLAIVDSSGRRTEFRNLSAHVNPVIQPPAIVNTYWLRVYPNPFNPSTTISFSLATAANVKLSVFDISGRAVRVIADGSFEAGEHSLIFDGRELATGIYFARLSAGEVEKTSKLLLIR